MTYGKTNPNCLQNHRVRRRQRLPNESEQAPPTLQYSRGPMVCHKSTPESTTHNVLLKDNFSAHTVSSLFELGCIHVDAELTSGTRATNIFLWFRSISPLTPNRLLCLNGHIPEFCGHPGSFYIELQLQLTDKTASPPGLPTPVGIQRSGMASLLLHMTL